MPCMPTDHKEVELKAWLNMSKIPLSLIKLSDTLFDFIMLYGGPRFEHCFQNKNFIEVFK